MEDKNQNKGPVEKIEDTSPPAPEQTSLLSDADLGTQTIASDNPLEDAVPKATTTAQAPKKPISKKRQRVVRRIGPGFYVGCIGFIVLLFVILVSLLVFFGGVDPTLFQAFNIPTEQVPIILSGLVNATFGLLAIIIFVGLLGSLLQLVLLKKTEKERRKPLLYSIIFAVMCLIIVLPAWFIVASSIRIATPPPPALPVIQVSARIGEQGEFIPLEEYNNLQAPIEVRFSAAGAQDAYPNYRIINYEWDVDGDGLYMEGRSGMEVAWRYEDKGKNNGLFDVTLKMTMEALPGNPSVPAGERREFTSRLPLTIATVAPTPVLAITPPNGEGIAPLTVEFDASRSYDGDSPNLEFYWNFDVDGDRLYNDATGPETRFTFEEPGEYMVSVRVQDLDGNARTLDQPIIVRAPGDTTPNAVIMASPMSGQAPLRVAFDAGESSSPAGAITRYVWNMGDGTITNGVIVNHTFSQGGTFPVKLTITDSAGQTAEVVQEITVGGITTAPRIALSTNPPLTYDYTTQENIISGGVPLQVSFDASGTIDPDNDIIAYEWDFDGDGVFDATGSKVTHTFTTGGNTLVRLRVRDSAGNMDERTLRIRQEQVSLQARMQVTPISGAVPLRVQFDASPSTFLDGSIEAYRWDFGDGTPPRNTNAQVTYTYQTVGTYTATLTILTNDGREASTTQRIIVMNVPLNAMFTPSVRAGKVPLTVDFDASATEGNVQQFLWDFGDGTTISRKNPTHTFRQPGTYNVRLRILDSDGVEDEYMQQITVLQ